MARTKAVVLRLSEEEYNLLKELSGREPMNAYLRRVAGLEVQVTTLTPSDVKVDASNVEAVERMAEMLEPSLPEPPGRIVEHLPPPKWFCPTCERLSLVPRCPKDPSHKVTPA